MIGTPTPDEWDTSQLAVARRAYLDSGVSFEHLVTRLLRELEILDATVGHYRAPASGEPCDARQIVFAISVSSEACDLLYNAPDGLRGRYWQCPDRGLTATKHLIEVLSPTLTSFAMRTAPSSSGKAAPMTPGDIAASLQAPSAKIWPRERNKAGDWLFIDDKLMVARWCRNERYAETKKGMWRLGPRGGELEIKGAILGRDRTEYIPEGKRGRSLEIHRFGFT